MSMANMLDATNYQIAQLLGRRITSGRTFFVNSVTGSSTSVGRQPRSPISTLAGAVASGTASKGDTFVLLEGHAETVSSAGGVTINVAGVNIVGLGTGSNRPTFTFSTSTAATFAISSDNVFISGVRFVGNVQNLVKMLDVGSNNVTFEDCEFVSSSGKEVNNFVAIATTYDNITFRRCTFHQPTDPAATNGGANTGAIYCVDTERVLVEDCVFDGFFETACLHNKTTAMKYLTWRRNAVNQQLTDAVRVLTPVGCVGMSYGPDADFIPGRGYPAKRATAAPPAAAATTAYFNVNGAPVEITNFNGEVTTAFATGGGASSLKFQANPTATGSSVDMCAAKDVSTEVVGNLINITGTLATALGTGLALIGQSTPIRVQVGTIDATMATTTLASGSAKWSLSWMPVDYSLGVPNVIAV